MTYQENMEKNHTEGFIKFLRLLTSSQYYLEVTTNDFKTKTDKQRKLLFELGKEREYSNMDIDDSAKNTLSIFIMKERREITQRMIESTEKFYSFMTNMCYIFSVSLFEFYIQDILKYIFYNNKSSFKSDKKLTYEEILSYEDLDSLHEYIIDKVCTNLGSYKKIKNLFNEKFNIDFTKFTDDKKIIDIFQIRHLLVHNDGIVNKKYLDIVKPSKYKEKDKINLTKNDLISAHTALHHLAYQIDRYVKEKYSN